MKKLYIIRRIDFFDAQLKGQIPEGSLMQMGTLWCTLALTDEEAEKYTYPKY